jgi:signal transduction histidine kinase
MSHLVNDLLDLSKIQAGKLTIRKKKFSIDPVIREIVSNIQNMTKTHIIVIKGQTKKKVYADKEKISQVLTNLLNNAIKYSPKSDKIILTIQTTKQHIIIDVQDFGIGIAKKDQIRIFEHLFRVHEQTYPGFGVGLYISNEIIKRHQGKLWLKSVKGQGSIFSFSLPIFIP